MAKQSEPFCFWKLVLLVVLVVLSPLGAWIVTHDQLMALMTVFAALAVLIIMGPHGGITVGFKTLVFSGDIKRSSK